MNRFSTPDIDRKKLLLIIGSALLISCSVMFITTTIHEGLHLVMDMFDSNIRVVGFHLFIIPPTQQNLHTFSSLVGCVVYKEAYPGSLKNRPMWIDPLQEIICLSVQIFITCYILLKGLTYILNKQSIATTSVAV